MELKTKCWWNSGRRITIAFHKLIPIFSHKVTRFIVGLGFQVPSKTKNTLYKWTFVYVRFFAVDRL